MSDCIANRTKGENTTTEDKTMRRKLNLRAARAKYPIPYQRGSKVFLPAAWQHLVSFSAGWSAGKKSKPGKQTDEEKAKRQANRTTVSYHEAVADKPDAKAFIDGYLMVCRLRDRQQKLAA